MTRPTMCFIDTMRPVTTAEKECWDCYLALPKAHWPKARVMFRQVHQGKEPAAALLEFVKATGFDSRVMLTRLQELLRKLAEERKGSQI